jgi:hypothetical protein
VLSLLTPRASPTSRQSRAAPNWAHSRWLAAKHPSLASRDSGSGLARQFVEAGIPPRIPIASVEKVGYRRRGEWAASARMQWAKVEHSAGDAEGKSVEE